MQGGGGTWSRDGVILFSSAELDSGIMRVNASGGACTPVTKPEPESDHYDPEFLPDGKHFLYLVLAADTSKDGVYFASLNDPRGHSLLAGRSSAVYAPPSAVGGHGHLLFLRDTTLMAQPFDEGKLQLAGDPVAVAEHASNNWSGGPLASASANGILVYGNGPDSSSPNSRRS